MVKLIVSDGDNWQCPYCGHHQVVLCDRRHVGHIAVRNDKSVLGKAALVVRSIVCANADCRKMSFGVGLWGRKDVPGTYGDYKLEQPIQEWTLLPESLAKPQPDYIPAPIRTDYYETCRIRDLSPKASATISRRCLQGMIRNFCGVTKGRLVDEINELRRLVDTGAAPPGVQVDTIDAIDHVRSVGNIGAHMEADINVIVDVDADEAQALIGLIELLFEEWYVARDTRARRLKAIGAVAADKKVAKAAASSERTSAVVDSEASGA